MKKANQEYNNVQGEEPLEQPTKNNHPTTRKTKL